jgi:hypothetical protein
MRVSLITHSQYHCTTAHIKSSNHTLSLHRITSCTLLYSSSLPLYSGRLVLSLGILLTYRRGTDTDLQKTHHVIAIQPAHWRSGWTYKNICHVISKHCCVTSLRMCKLHGHKDNTAGVLLAVCVLRALPGNGFTCRNIKIWNREPRLEYEYVKGSVVCILQGRFSGVKRCSIHRVPATVATGRWTEGLFLFKICKLQSETTYLLITFGEILTLHVFLKWACYCL